MIEEDCGLYLRQRKALSRWSNADYRLREHNVSFRTCLLMPITAHNIAVQSVVEFDTFVQSEQYGKPMWVVKILADGSLPLLVSKLRGSSQLQTLSINLETTLPGYEFKDDANQFPVKVELDHLDGLKVPSLNKLEVDIIWHPHYEDRPDTMLAFEMALDDLGRTLVGGRGTVAHRIKDESPLNSVYTYIRT